jgi:serine/threonine protein kinase
MYMNKVINSGFYGIILHPSIDCNEGIPSNDDTIGKIALEKHNKLEYDIIRSLPAFHNAPYVTSEEVTLCEIDPNWLLQYEDKDDAITEFIELVDEDEDNKLTQLTMPYLGLDFLEYMSQFQNPYAALAQVYSNKNATGIMDVPTLKRIMHALNILYQQIEEMNLRGVYHEDIKENNVMYNPDTNTFKLIDFGLSTSIHVKESTRTEYYEIKNLFKLHITEKIQFLKYLIGHVLYIACNNNYIYSVMLPMVKELERVITLLTRYSNFHFFPEENIDLDQYTREAIDLSNVCMSKLTEGVNSLREDEPVEKTPHLPHLPFLKDKETHIPKLFIDRSMHNFKVKMENEREMNKEDKLSRKLRTTTGGKKRRKRNTKTIKQNRKSRHKKIWH